MNKSRRVLLALYLVSPFLAAELYIRWRISEETNRHLIYYHRQFSRALYEPDPKTIWRGKPNASVTIPNLRGEEILYSQNKGGWRDREWNPQKQNALVLGDSYTFGVGVNAEDRYFELIEKQIKGLKFWNYSILGGAPDQYLKFLESWPANAKLNLLIVQISHNDIWDLTDHEWSDIDPLSGTPAKIQHPIRRFYSKYSEAWNAIIYTNLMHHSADNTLGLRRLTTCLTELAKAAKRRRVPLIILNGTNWGAHFYLGDIPTKYEEEVRRIAKEWNAQLIYMDNLDSFPFPDSHWTKKGHQQVAEEILSSLKNKKRPLCLLMKICFP